MLRVGQDVRVFDEGGKASVDIEFSMRGMLQYKEEQLIDTK